MSFESSSSLPYRTLAAELKRFPWGFFFTALCLLVAGHIIGTDTWNLTKEFMPFWGMLSVGFMFMLLVSAMLIKIRHEGEHLPWVLMALTLVGGNWIGLGFHEVGHHLGWVLLMMAVILHLVLHRRLHSWRKHQKLAEDRGHIMSQQELAEYPPHLVIMLLSKPSVLQLPAELQAKGPVTLTFKAQGAQTPPQPVLTLKRECLDDDVLALEKAKLDYPYFNWQQQLRALRTPEFLNVPEIVLLGSEKEYVEKSVLFFRPYVKSKHLHGLVVEKFADFDALHEKLHELIRSRGVEPHRVVVDITGGFAPSSVAAAVFTVKCSTRIQWVPTGDNPRAVQENILNIPNRYYDIRQLVLPFPSES